MAGVGVMRRLLALVVGAITLAGIAQAQGQDDVARLSAEVSRLHRQGKYAQGLPIAHRYVELARQQYGEEHAQFAMAVGWLAHVYRAQGRLADAEPLYGRSLAILEKAVGPGHAAVGALRNILAEVYRKQGRLAEAGHLFRRNLAIREKALGPEHPDVAQSLSNLAELYLSHGRLAEAEPLYKRSLAIFEKALGPEHLRVGTSLNSLAELYRVGGRLAEAEPLYRRSLSIREKALGPEHAQVGASLNNLAGLYWAQGRLAEAEPLYGRSLAITEKALGPEHPDVATTLNNLAVLYQDQGRFAEAESQARRSLAIYEKALGPEHPQVGVALNNLAEVYRDQGRFAEAEPLYRRSLTIREKALGPEHPDVAQSLNNLGGLYQAQGRLAEAEPLFRRSLAIRERALGPEHPDTGQSLNNLAMLYQDQRRLAEAEPLHRRSLAIREKTLGPEHPDVGQSLNNLAMLYQGQGRLAEAEPLHRRSLGIYERALGPEHPQMGTSLNNLALLYRAQGRLAEAEPLFMRSLAIGEKALGPDHPGVALLLDNLAVLALDQRDWGRAADYWRRASGMIERRARRGLADAMEGSSKGEAQRRSWYFLGLVRMTHRLAAAGHASGMPAAEMFETAQWALASEAAASLAQMAARSAAGSSELARLMRERQDLAGEWQAKDKLLIAAKTKEPGKRNASAEKALAERLGAINARLADIGGKLAKDFPGYAALASPAPVSVADAQAQLRADEALVLFLDTDSRFKPLPEETFVWVVTRSEVRWARSDLGTAALRREVAALRCGLDSSLWDARDKRARCIELLGAQRDFDGANVLPFPVARAHALYKALLGEVEDLLTGKHLLIVPSGALTQLPFQVLVTAGVGPTESDTVAQPSASGGHEKADGRGGVTGSNPQGLSPPFAAYRGTAWLGARQPITVLPAVSSLRALRAYAKASRAGKAYLGIGNPLLDGPDARFAELARKARASRICPVASTPEATLDAGQGGVAPVEIRGRLANVADIRTQPPLPETAEELCAVARDLKADVSEVRLGERATETEVKRLSRSGELARYRVLHFATHGAMAGELTSAREPGLILTPPNKASEQDDGYLAASEIAALKVDADWVILSACNTAAGGASSAEALSGIARAFIYAGARALLVSHWAVDSNATVKLVTKAASEMARDDKVGRAEAMRRAMLAVIQSGTHEAHPSYWAPFVVVGEGAAAR